ncbi:hypothetical protein PLESTB_000063500 [Pleodorina starrii]|uniref:Uncharacterized protein n=1 Tax=Pleodorina starrii TaxID=330485 RepID=A0A9W6B9S5_9CHLO|nr:hypothetical protein PLESTB_000063500 [Pleodorina starrii]
MAEPPQTVNHALGLFEQLPEDLLASYIWGQLSRRDRKRLRQAGRGMAQYAASELMRHLKVLVCRTSLLQLTSACRTLHQLFPHPVSLELYLLPPARRDGQGAAGAAAAGAAHVGGGGTTEDGWHGSTAVMSYFLSELGQATSVTSLSLQGWQELSARDLHHLAATYPRLTRLHLAGLPGNNFLSGSSLETLGPRSRRCPVPPHPCSGPERLDSSSSAAAGPGPGSGLVPELELLREVVVDTQLLMEPQAALESLSRLPRLSSLDLTGVPLLPCLELPLSLLRGLTRLEITFEHKHAHSEQQLGGLGELSGLRHLGLDFMQLGAGSSLWSAGWLLSHVLSRLTRLTALHLPRAFLYDKSHPYFLQTLAALPHLTDLALGSIILSPETAAAAAASPPASPPAAAASGSSAAAAAATSPPGSRPPEETCTTSAGDLDGGAIAGDNGSGEARGVPASSSSSPPPSLARPYRRLALGAAMPCYLEALLPVMLGWGHGDAASAQVVSEEGREAAQLLTACPSPSCTSGGGVRAGGNGGAGGGDGSRADGGGAGGGGGGLDLLELSTPCTLQMVQLLPRFIRRSGSAAACTAASTAAAAAAGGAAGGGGGGSGVREVRLMLRLSANWAEVLAAAAAVGSPLTSLALLPTYLYGSGTMMPPQVVSAVAAALPLLEHLELYRLNTDPRDITCLADMPRLRFVLLGVADEARERRGSAHPESLVRSLLAALHVKRSRGSGRGGGGGGGGDSSTHPDSGAGAAAASLFVNSGGGGEGGRGCKRPTAFRGSNPASGSGGDGHVSGGGGGSGTVGGGGGAVVCCPELSEEEAARLDELCEVEYGTYDLYGSRLRVERSVDGTLPWRLAVGCSRAPARWRP